MTPHVSPGQDCTIDPTHFDDSKRSAKRLPKEGDVIQTGIIFANGDGSINWSTHQVIRRISSDGTIWYRPREAKVDKSPQYWRFPVESIEEIIRDLRRYANPKEAKAAIAILRGEHP